MGKEKTNITQYLRRLAIGANVRFQLRKRTSILATIQRIKYEGYKFSTRTDGGELIVEKLSNPKKI